MYAPYINIVYALTVLSFCFYATYKKSFRKGTEYFVFTLLTIGSFATFQGFGEPEWSALLVAYHFVLGGTLLVSVLFGVELLQHLKNGKASTPDTEDVYPGLQVFEMLGLLFVWLLGAANLMATILVAARIRSFYL
jgi:hypothetical protein